MRIPKAGKRAMEQQTEQFLEDDSAFYLEYLKIFTTFDNYFTPKR